MSLPIITMEIQSILMGTKGCYGSPIAPGIICKKRNGAQVTLPHGDARLRVALNSSRALISWRKTNDCSPRTVEFVCESKLLEESIQLLTLVPPGKGLNERKEAVERVEQTMKDGQVMGRFEVLDWTEQVGIGLPKLWRMSILSGGKIVWAYQGTTERVTGIERVEIPVVPQYCELWDKRVRSVENGINGVIYTITNGEIPNVDDPVLQEKVTRVRSRDNKLMPPDLFKPRALIPTIIFILLSLPVAVQFFRKRKSCRTESHLCIGFESSCQ